MNTNQPKPSKFFIEEFLSIAEANEYLSARPHLIPVSFELEKRRNDFQKIVIMFKRDPGDAFDISPIISMLLTSLFSKPKDVRKSPRTKKRREPRPRDPTKF